MDGADFFNLCNHLISLICDQQLVFLRQQNQLIK